jgi:hypothetical protein
MNQQTEGLSTRAVRRTVSAGDERAAHNRIFFELRKGRKAQEQLRLLLGSDMSQEIPEPEKQRAAGGHARSESHSPSC